LVNQAPGSSLGLEALEELTQTVESIKNTAKVVIENPKGVAFQILDDGKKKAVAAMAGDPAAMAGINAAGTQLATDLLLGSKGGKTALTAAKRVADTGEDVARALARHADDLTPLPRVAGASPGAAALATGPSRGTADAFQTTLRKVETLDFSTGNSRAVFYSGPGQWERARTFAERTGRQTIEMTRGGRALEADTLFQSLSPNEQFLVWQHASAFFARGTSGEVTAFLRGARPERTFRTIEEPILRANPAVYRYIYRY
jgi:hypothetical protein